MLKAKEWVPGEAQGYWHEPAPQEAVDYVLSRPVEDGLEDGLCQEDGRSQWVWIRLPDGDLILGVYPQGDTYFATEQWRTI